jgi:hypothetical protein
MMGDIVQTEARTVDLHVEAITHTPMERIDILNGKEVVHTLRGYGSQDIGNRIRVVWSGAKYRGRGRESRWTGQMTLKGARITRFEKINVWNPERLFEQRGDFEIVWDTITTGNFVGFDIWLDDVGEGQLVLKTNRVKANLALGKVGLEDIVFEAGGLDRKLRIFRLPETNRTFQLRDTVQLPLKPKGDNPLWVRVTTDDGFNAWSSPIYIFSEG